MQPLKITIEGDFWDCQIYMGLLYLWYTDGSVGVYHWDKLVETTFSNQVDKLVLQCAFTRGDFLYKNMFLIEEQNSQFLKASNQELSINLKQLKQFEYSKQENPLGELPTDSCIYYSTLFTITELGIYSASVKRKNIKFGINKRSKKLWDCPLLSIKASHKALAMAGGDEGVFELHLNDYNNDLLNLEKIDDKIYKISDQHSSLVDWSFASLYCSSYVEPGFLAAFGWEKNQKTRRLTRTFKKIIPESKIFEKSGFSWGTQEKIYLANCNTIEVVKYVQNKIDSKNESKAFQHLESIKFDERHGEVISGGISYFGVIIEFEEALSVLCSDNTIVTFPEAVARWRVYPRSIRYKNHLHIVYEDRLVIYSFNHDYFVNQADKIKGIQYRKN